MTARDEDLHGDLRTTKGRACHTQEKKRTDVNAATRQPSNPLSPLRWRGSVRVRPLSGCARGAAFACRKVGSCRTDSRSVFAAPCMYAPTPVAGVTPQVVRAPHGYGGGWTAGERDEASRARVARPVDAENHSRGQGRRGGRYSRRQSRPTCFRCRQNLRTIHSP